MIHHKVFSGVVYAAVIAVIVVIFKLMPSSFLPEEDQGVVFTLVQLPPNASMERTSKTIDSMTNFFLKNEEKTVQSVFSLSSS